jgi:hypothetical protein
MQFYIVFKNELVRKREYFIIELKLFFNYFLKGENKRNLSN